MLSFQEEYKSKIMMRILIDSDGLEVDVIIELCDGRRTALLEQITSRLTVSKQTNVGFKQDAKKQVLHSVVARGKVVI